MIDLIYILPSEKGPTGGIKVAAQHSKIINELKKIYYVRLYLLKRKKYQSGKALLIN
jgi:hypothetical protein